MDIVGLLSSTSGCFSEKPAFLNRKDRRFSWSGYFLIIFFVVKNVEFAKVVQRNADKACRDDDTSVLASYFSCETIGLLFVFRIVFVSFFL